MPFIDPPTGTDALPADRTTLTTNAATATRDSAIAHRFLLRWVITFAACTTPRHADG